MIYAVFNTSFQHSAGTSFKCVLCLDQWQWKTPQLMISAVFGRMIWYSMIWSWNPIIANPPSARHAATLLPFKPSYCGRKLKWWFQRWYGSPKWVYRGQYILPGFRLGCISYNHAKELFFCIIGHLCVGEVVWCGSRFVTAYGLWNSHIKGLISPSYPKSRFSGWDIFCGWSHRRDSGVRSEFQPQYSVRHLPNQARARIEASVRQVPWQERLSFVLWKSGAWDGASEMLTRGNLSGNWVAFF